jgi:hypothetical protein
MHDAFSEVGNSCRVGEIRVDEDDDGGDNQRVAVTLVWVWNRMEDR